MENIFPSLLCLLYINTRIIVLFFLAVVANQALTLPVLQLSREGFFFFFLPSVWAISVFLRRPLCHPPHDRPASITPLMTLGDFPRVLRAKPTKRCFRSSRARYLPFEELSQIFVERNNMNAINVFARNSRSPP